MRNAWWWREQDAYAPLVNVFRRAHINNGETLAFYVIVVDRAGFGVIPKSQEG